MNRAYRAGRIATVAAVQVLAAAAPGFTQAWLPPKGEATFAQGYQYAFARYHLTSDGQDLDRGQMRWSSLVSDLSYGVTDRLSLRVGLPYVFSKYSGAFPHLPPGRTGIDDGSWHGTLQDVRIEARFMATTGSVVVTPFVVGVVPISQYETHAHAAAGKGLWEASAGLYVGRRLDPVLPDAYTQVRLAFTVPERPLGVWHNRTNATVDLGYFVTPALTLRTTGAWQRTHGGYRFPVDAPAGSINFLHHDQLLREQLFQLGLTASYALTGALDVFGSGFHTFSGQNSVRMNGVAFGVSWSFSPERALRKKGASARHGPGSW